MIGNLPVLQDQEALSSVPQLAVQTIQESAMLLDNFSNCAQCGYPVSAIKGDSHNFCQNCGFRDSCC